jgi:alanine dehydrogenase
MNEGSSMRIGVPKEIKTHEYRVGLTPEAVREFTARGHTVVVQSGAAIGIGFSDADYMAAGATLAASAVEVYAQAEMVVKVKEPSAGEIALLREGQVLFAYLHLAADREQTLGLMRSRATCIAYETVTDSRGALPLLAPMSEVAGRMSVQVGARCLEKESGGAGVLLGGVPGVPAGRVVVIGGGVSGTNAATMAVGVGAHVTVFDRSITRLKELDQLFGPRVQTLFSTTAGIEKAVAEADLVIGAVLVPGATAPKLVTRAMVARMRPGSVVVDIAIDQGGCFETSRPTSHAQPTYIEEGVVHYCVTNMPGAVARTSTIALGNATLPYALALAEKGWQQALIDDVHLRHGLNVHAGFITYAAVAKDLSLDYRSPETILGPLPFTNAA